jgi:biopolymer transport protein ExbD/biopolymer transport protein TolR
MAMSAGRDGGAIASINVTPMADIMIVLLIIFMVTIPIISRGSVQLPIADHAANRQEDAKTIVVTLERDTTTRLGDDKLLTPSDLLPRLQQRFADRPEAGRVVYLKADEGLSYAEVRRVMDLCRTAGAEQVALMARSRSGR